MCKWRQTVWLQVTSAWVQVTFVKSLVYRTGKAPQFQQQNGFILLYKATFTTLSVITNNDNVKENCTEGPKQTMSVNAQREGCMRKGTVRYGITVILYVHVCQSKHDNISKSTFPSFLDEELKEVKSGWDVWETNWDKQ